MGQDPPQQGPAAPCGQGAAHGGATQRGAAPAAPPPLPQSQLWGVSWSQSPSCGQEGNKVSGREQDGTSNPNPPPLPQKTHGDNPDSIWGGGGLQTFQVENGASTGQKGAEEQLEYSHPPLTTLTGAEGAQGQRGSSSWGGSQAPGGDTRKGKPRSWKIPGWVNKANKAARGTKWVLG